ncbi:hypothetical protein ACFWHQ_37155 [Streptomyces sp. NPDC060334]|uniref:hypothetical protein n=1 Tax=unclassified Streptomyces TaxID=2593676 RepID=UPI0006AFC16A|nr:MULTISPECIES: hypothetical protein [unclassified Streptomyces]KOU48561.1 hypothetical protein ADK55_19585 [Streptomyces sp. WM4235]MCX5073516.1 hypothetical protein [Streptomyces sp. NBC_00424]MCX5154934.1 hypothetical protein [Streptomyces sp. NBC_00291]WUD43235.1 hypothetical protein OHA84_23485 [Streptomyces sp. NBC_00513]
MTVDPAEPDTFRERLREDLDPETPEADAAEQHIELQPVEDDPLTGADLDEATDGDAAEQARVVPLDEDDYR